MIHDEVELRIFALLSMQAALLGIPTPNLRSVSVGWKGGDIRAEFTYDIPVDDDLAELVSVGETEVLADLYEGMTAIFTTKYLPTSEVPPLPGGHAWVYWRREE